MVRHHFRSQKQAAQAPISDNSLATKVAIIKRELAIDGSMPIALVIDQANQVMGIDAVGSLPAQADGGVPDEEPGSEADEPRMRGGEERWERRRKNTAKGAPRHQDWEDFGERCANQLGVKRNMWFSPPFIEALSETTPMGVYSVGFG